MNAQTQIQDTTIECNLEALDHMHTDFDKVVKKMSNIALDNAIVELDRDITTVALKAQRTDDYVKELEGIVETQGALLLDALRRITLLEQGAKTTPGVDTRCQ